ncbi:cell lysis protein cwl1 [Paecilomyces variotii No. 5]|uniref:Reticulon-like protein n=1 Tax=Byssochlamys spectabilis (strain No. 5 / NBRC 109023) TaxID=1356009 RepID=V5FM43_BYSSN|nr:cell lysis protein cwl1 [Paecilomyces variotii No. 5]
MASTNTGDVNYPVTNGTSVKDTVLDGPVVQNIKSEANRTGDEFRGLKGSKVESSSTTATGQPLTPYHSLLYSLLSWEHPRATALSFASVVTFIFAARYLPLIRWAFKFLYLALGFTATLEIAGKLVLSQGLASSFRPRKYYTVPKEAIEGVLEDLEQLVDFFLIEFQRILFAENIIHTVAAFTAAFLSYWLIKIVPLWGLSLIGVTIAYLGPLIYINNRELIDAHIENAQKIAHSQANQVKDLAGQHTSHATGLVKQYAGTYSSKAQEYIGNRRSVSPEVSKVAPPAFKTEPVPESKVQQSDFPEAPKEEPVGQTVESPVSAVQAEPEIKPEPLIA